MTKKSRYHKTYCSQYDCLIWTCSRHRRHLSSRKRLYDWADFHETCGMYKSKNRWQTFYLPPIDEWELEIEDEIETDREESKEDTGDT